MPPNKFDFRQGLMLIKNVGGGGGGNHLETGVVMLAKIDKRLRGKSFKFFFT